MWTITRSYRGCNYSDRRTNTHPSPWSMRCPIKVFLCVVSLLSCSEKLFSNSYVTQVPLRLNQVKANVQRQGILSLKVDQRDQITSNDINSEKCINNFALPRFLQLIVLSTLVFGICDVTLASAYKLLLKLIFNLSLQSRIQWSCCIF